MGCSEHPPNKTKIQKPNNNSNQGLDPPLFRPGPRLGSNLNDPHAFGKQHLKAHGKGNTANDPCLKFTYFKQDLKTN